MGESMVSLGAALKGALAGALGRALGAGIAIVMAVAFGGGAPSSTQAQVPFPEGTRSVEVIDDGAVVYVSPDRGAARRGTLQEGARIRAVRRVESLGCRSGFAVMLGREAYVCDQAVAASRQEPGATPVIDLRGGELLPHRYAFVTVDATRAFARPEDYLIDDYVESLGDGNAFVVAGAARFDGVRFVKTRRGLYVPAEALRFPRASTFSGVALSSDDVALGVGWVKRANAPVYDRPGGRVIRRAGHREVVRTTEVGRSKVTLAEGAIMRRRDVALMRPSAPPAELATGERWIDVDTSEQVLTAYEGTTPVYATLISTGRALETHRTPKGVFRIWVKLAYSDMDDLERTDVEQNYAIEAVPWVQYFEGSNGFHAAFWHDDFGRRKSHGCVNLSPTDARWLFDFTGPALPDGWSAILPTERDPGTLVRVR